MNDARETINITRYEMLLLVVSLVFVLCYSFFFDWDLSLLKIIVTITVISAVLVRWKSPGNVRRSLEILLITVMTFTIILSGLRLVTVFTFSVPFKTSYPDVLDQNLRSLIEGIKRSPVFNLILFEHGGRISFESLEFNSFGDYIEVGFFSEIDYMSVTLTTIGGSCRMTSRPYLGTPISRMYNQSTTSEELLFQLDSKGLRWLHDNAIQALQNKIGYLPSFDGIGFMTSYEALEDYEGSTFCLFGTQSNGRGASSVWFSNYLPNGTLLSVYLSY